jgi:hypothetical protein
VEWHPLASPSAQWVNDIEDGELVNCRAGGILSRQFFEWVIDITINTTSFFNYLKNNLI